MDRNRKSFTFIEILLVTSIIIILSGTSLAFFSIYRDDRILSKQVQLFSTVLELAKSKASAGDTSQCANSTLAHISGYSVQVDSSVLSLIPGCDTIPTPQSFPIPTSIHYTPSSFTLQFDSHNYQGSTQQYILKSTTDDTHCKYVQIDVSGLITNGDITCP